VFANACILVPVAPIALSNTRQPRGNSISYFVFIFTSFHLLWLISYRLCEWKDNSVMSICLYPSMYFMTFNSDHTSHVSVLSCQLLAMSLIFSSLVVCLFIADSSLKSPICFRISLLPPCGGPIKFVFIIQITFKVY